MTRPPTYSSSPASLLRHPRPRSGPTPSSFWPLIRNPLSHRHSGPRAGTQGTGAATIIPHTHTPPPSCRRRNVPPYSDTGTVPWGAARLPTIHPPTIPTVVLPSIRRYRDHSIRHPQGGVEPHATPSRHSTDVLASIRHSGPRAGTQGGAATPQPSTLRHSPSPPLSS